MNETQLYKTIEAVRVGLRVVATELEAARFADDLSNAQILLLQAEQDLMLRHDRGEMPLGTDLTVTTEHLDLSLIHLSRIAKFMKEAFNAA